MASIVTIVIGVGLMVQAFNSAAEASKAVAGNAIAMPELGGDVMVDLLCGITGIVLGVLALVGIVPQYLVPSALIVFGGSLLLGGALSMRTRSVQTAAPGGQTQIVAYPGSAAAGGMEILVGIAAIVLGILSLIFATLATS